MRYVIGVDIGTSGTKTVLSTQNRLGGTRPRGLVERYIYKYKQCYKTIGR